MTRCARQWRNLKQIKRGGGGHLETGLASVPDGTFALECPACLHPGHNLPEAWDQAPEDIQYGCVYCPLAQESKPLFRWLYSCFLAVDANFCLKLKSHGINNPEIGSGWSYFVGHKQYSKHISQRTADTEVSL